jgi:hypothetical protein
MEVGRKGRQDPSLSSAIKLFYTEIVVERDCCDSRNSCSILSVIIRTSKYLHTKICMGRYMAWRRAL